MAKQRLIYGIGGTGSTIVSKLKNISDETFVNDTIFRVWDIDNATNNLDNLTESEKIIFTGDSIRSQIRRIKDDRINNVKLYNQIQEVFPLDDDGQINELPTSKGIGAAKQPIVSRLVGTIEAKDISKKIKSDCEIAQTGVTGNAYLVLSPCGGTSTGLHIQILTELLRRKYNVFVFFVSPNFYDELSPNDKFTNHANTVATLLRVYYDLEKKKMIYSKDTEQHIDSEIYPFIIESEWESGRNRAEFCINTELNNTNPEFFYAYNAYALLSFFKANNCTSNFISLHQNKLHNIASEKSYFNMLLLYPVNNSKAKIKSAILKAFETENGKGATENLKIILQKNPEFEVVYNARLVKSALVDLISKNAHDFSLGDIFDMLSWCKNRLDDETVRQKWRSNNTLSNIFELTDEDEEGTKKTGFLKRLYNTLWAEKEEVESDTADIQQLSNDQKNAIQDIYDYLTQLIELSQSNIKALENDSELPFHKVNFDNEVIDTLNINASNLFQNDFIDGYVEKSYENGLNTRIQLPPSLSNWNNNEHFEYSKIIAINGNFYLLKVHSEIPDHALGYLRGDYIRDFAESKKKGYLSYPDKRLNGIFPPDNETFVDFVQWEEQVLSTLKHKNQKNSNISNEVSILCLALITDNISTIECPVKVLDFNTKDEKFFLEANLNVKGVNLNIVGEQTPNWYEAALFFLKKINDLAKPDPLGLGNGIKTDIEKLIQSSKKQIFDHCNNHDKTCILNAYNKVIELKNSLTESQDEQTEKAIIFIDQIIIYLTHFAGEYKKQVNNKREIPGIKLND